jgi:hypothetical protein
MNRLPTAFIALLVMMLALSGFIGGMAYAKMHPAVHVNLPEEYRLITARDHLRGNYDSMSNTVTIEFDNTQNK